MGNVTNKQLLLGLAGLGLLNALLCFVVILREGSNGERIGRLSSELAAARAAQTEQGQAQQQELSRLRDETRGALQQSNEQLSQARADLARAQAVLAFYREKPWLNRKDTKEPWEAAVKQLAARLSDLEKAIEQLRPPPPKQPARLDQLPPR
jgi:chromosome segregation ATPase